MEIFKKQAYNHKVGRYKTLSSNAGVGSIVTTSAGYFVMPLSVTRWQFIGQLNTIINNRVNNNYPDNIILDEIKSRIDVIDDPRFIDFLRKEKNLDGLKFIVEVPYLGLDEYNNPKYDKHPLFLRYKAYNGTQLSADDFMIPAIHFPRWFYSSRNMRFMPIERWEVEWQRCVNDRDLVFFAPPRDPSDDTGRTFKHFGEQRSIYRQLKQVPLLLICDKGHISDIPWNKYFCAKVDGSLTSNTRDGFDLFGYDCNPCRNGGEHELIWVENRNNPESWGMIKCAKCKEACSLEGIMNIRPLCPGHKPWNGDRSFEQCLDATGRRNKMRVVMATSNSVYYADSFRGLYIPSKYLDNKATLSRDSRVFLDMIENNSYERWKQKAENTGKSLADFINGFDNGYFLQKASDNGLNDISADHINEIREYVNNTAQDNDSYEVYRFDEYKALTKNNTSNSDIPGLSFNDINLDDLDPRLKPYFNKIQQVETLSITQTQLGFTRGSMQIPRIDDNGQLIRESGQKIYSCNDDEVRLLPAYRSYGEGIFIEFNREQIDQWIEQQKETLDTRYAKVRSDIGNEVLQDVDRYGRAPFYMLHTFAHILIKELEFSCGYPSASLQERLYYSDRMCGVLIYTTDGTEGSMGGLVWQAQPNLISNIIIKALNRAKNCSSDPLCSLEEDQINLAACFSCCIISETSCEKKNLCLDRLSIIGDFGFFNAI